MSDFEDDATSHEHSPEPHFPAQAPRLPRVWLTDIEARVLGSLIEKEFLTPDIYPMTTKAIVTACNQKTNRDPVVAFTPIVVDNTLLELRQRNLVRRVHSQGSRSTKHRQALDEALSLAPGELALISVLLLRGEQTIGELRLRSERQHGFEDLEATEACLLGLANRPEPLVRQLARQPGHKEARWKHLLADPDAVSEMATEAPVEAPADDEMPSPGTQRQPAPAAEPRLADRIDELEVEVASLRRQLASLAASLGEPLDG